MGSFIIADVGERNCVLWQNALRFDSLQFLSILFGAFQNFEQQPQKKTKRAQRERISSPLCTMR